MLHRVIMLQRIFDEDYWAFEEKVRRYDLENLRNYYTEVLDDIEEVGFYYKNPLILDIGCGYGYFLQICAEKGYECLGLDISRYALLRISKKSAKVILCDVQSSLPLKSKSVDVAVMLDTIEHLNRPHVALREIKRVLKPKGLLYISTPNLTALMRMLRRSDWYGFQDNTHISLFTPFHLRKLLEKCNFNILKCYTSFDFPLFRRLMAKVFGRFYVGGQIRLISQNK